MATLTEQAAVVSSSATSPMTTIYDQDIDSFLNLDQLSYTSAEPARSKAISASQLSLPSTEFSTSDVRSASFAASNQSPIAFQGPSHQYEEHKQQTGLPPGALAHAMNFNNHMTGIGFSSASPGFAMNGDVVAGNQMKREDTAIDFNTVPTRNPSEMDLESDNMGALPTYYFSRSPDVNQFIDPNALGGHDVPPVSPSTRVGRMYPGMHQQQAAMAKAAQQQKQHEMLRQQQQQQQQLRHRQMQQNDTPQSHSSHSTNPLAEERITRLLQQIRQNTMPQSGDSPSPSPMPQMAKARKDEQDMDDDERLLASEEGKKLTSKERRQLRNKVSARAFRSRRKEYIGQLESEVAARTNEAHELRLQNRALFEENARLTDLAHMLLSSPHFSQFLDEMSVNGLPAPTQPQQHQQHQQHQQPHPQPQSHPQSQPLPPTMSQQPMRASIPKDVNPTHGPQGFPMPQNPHVGMVMVPNQALDVATMGMNNGGWNSGIDMNSYGNTPVFAVLEVPEGPALDAEILSGKTSNFIGTCLPEVLNGKEDAPIIEYPPMIAEQKEEPAVGVENLDIEFDESDPAFALFVDSPATSTSRTLPADSFNGIQSEKSVPEFELVVESECKTTMDRLFNLCNSMEAAFQRVSMVTSHLL